MVEPAWVKWTNAKGVEIVARFHGLSKGKVSFELKSGKKVAYPLEQLSKESQAKVKKLAAPSMMEMGGK